MPKIEIKALGLAALRISGTSKTIYVDSFINQKKHPLKPFEYGDADMILITHDHDDHYNAESVSDAFEKTDAVIVGPPSITYPLLADYRVPAEKLNILYNQDPGTPVSMRFDGITVSSFSSLHFNDGDNMTIHNSYLLEMDGKSVFITGDSNILTEKDKRLFSLDAMVFNIVTFGKDREKVDLLEEIQRKYSPGIFLPVHLMECDWTIGTEALKNEISGRNIPATVVLDINNNTVLI